MVPKDYEKVEGSSKSELGEIDTSSPFQSVKDAVGLFGEGAFYGANENPSIKKHKPQSAQIVLAKETQLHLAHTQLNKLNQKLQYSEATKSQALLELEKAKRTVVNLIQKLKILNESRNLAIMATDAAKHQAKHISVANNDSNREQEKSRAEYMSLVTELDASKQELRKIHQEYNASFEAKAKAEKQEAEAENDFKVNMRRLGELSQEFCSVRDSVQQANLACVQAKGDETKIRADKDEYKQSYKVIVGDSINKLLVLKKDIDPELQTNLETRLTETLSEIETLRSEMEGTRSADLDSVKTVTKDLNGAKESLHRVYEEERSLRSLVEKLKTELDAIKKELSESKDKEVETESIAMNLQGKLREAKSKLEGPISKEAVIRSSLDEMVASIQKLASENVNAKCEALEAKQKAEELKREAETIRIELEEAEKKLKAALNEAGESKVAEAEALDRIKILSEKTNAARASMLKPGAQITISSEEFELLSRKAEDSHKLADMKVAAARAQVEAMRAGESEALQRLESSWKETEDVKCETFEALRNVEMAEAAKKAVEGELRRWREREQKKAEETASSILAETERLFQVEAKVVEKRELSKAKTYFAKKALMMTSLSGVFFRKKKDRVEDGLPSYLPGEKPVW